MPTFKAVVFEHHLKSDKTVRIKIRVTHKRVSRYIDSNLVANTSELTKKFRLKDQEFIEQTNAIIDEYRKRCNRSAEAVAGMDCDELVRFLTCAAEALDFFAFADKQIQAYQLAGRTMTARDYNTAINALERFTGRRSLNVNEIKLNFLQRFYEFIVTTAVNAKKHSTQSRAPSHYLGSIRALHNAMRLQYNDEDSGIIRIPGTPFSRFKIPRRPATKKRALEPEQIKHIFDLPDMKGRGSRRVNLARDCFILSFAFVGMNSADLYDCEIMEGGTLTYYRKKTRSRRQDKAEIVLTVPVEVKQLVEKYRDGSGKKVFNFYQQFANESNFNKALNIGLKEILPGLEFYAARHSWASIALNYCGVDKYTVHTALNHVDEAMRVTDIYLKKDWRPINVANRKVLDFVLINKPVE